MNDDYTGAASEISEQEIVEEQADNAWHYNNIFAQGRANMIEIKIPEARLHKKNHVLWLCVFF